MFMRHTARRRCGVRVQLVRQGWSRKKGGPGATLHNRWWAGGCAAPCVRGMAGLVGRALEPKEMRARKP